jgi:hypothetical protein
MMRFPILAVTLTLATLVAGCSKAACTEKQMTAETTFDGVTLDDSQLTSARAAGWDCTQVGLETSSEGVVTTRYICSRCE